MRFLGALLIVFGLLFCFTFFGAIIGIPMMLIGAILLAIGGRRKTVIHNVVNVSNVVPSSPSQPLASQVSVPLPTDRLGAMPPNKQIE